MFEDTSTQPTTHKSNRPTPSALSSRKPNDREKAANPNHRDELLQRLLVNLFLAHPRKQSLRDTQANQQGEKTHDQE